MKCFTVNYNYEIVGVVVGNTPKKCAKALSLTLCIRKSCPFSYELHAHIPLEMWKLSRLKEGDITFSCYKLLGLNITIMKNNSNTDERTSLILFDPIKIAGTTRRDRREEE